MQFFEAFGVDLPKLAFQIINFLLLLYLLNRFLFKRVLRAPRRAAGRRSARGWRMPKRRRATASSREPSARRRVAEARKEANEMIARANKIAEDTRNEILADARTEAEKVSERARRRSSPRRSGRWPRSAARSPSSRSRLPASSSRREMDAPTQRRLVEEFLAEVEPANRPRHRAADRWHDARRPPVAMPRRPSRSAAPTARSTRGNATW